MHLKSLDPYIPHHLECLKEAGDCGFYKEVETQKMNCGQDEYAEGFGVKFCNAQKNQMGNFSPQVNAAT